MPDHFGVPGERWLNILMNRIDPEFFSACFMAWACALHEDAPDLIALDGKTSSATIALKAAEKFRRFAITRDPPHKGRIPPITAVRFSGSTS